MNDRQPVLIVRARPLELGQDRPKVLASLLERGQLGGWAIRDVRWALAYDWKLRRLAGVSGPGSMEWRNLPVESVSARMYRPEAVCYAVWRRIGGEAWRSEGGAVYGDQGVMRLGDTELRHYLTTLELPTHVRARDVQQ